MYIKRLFVLLMLLSGYEVSCAQQSRPVVEGEWELVKMDTRLLSQKDDHLLEKKTLTTLAEFRQVTGLIPVKISVKGDECGITTARGFTESGKYKLQGQGVLLYQKAMPQLPALQKLPEVPQVPQVPQINKDSVPPAPSPEMPYIPYHYRKESGGLLVLELPQAFFMDTRRNLPVVQECTCYFKKKQ